jgi:hypothetical protein
MPHRRPLRAGGGANASIKPLGRKAARETRLEHPREIDSAKARLFSKRKATCPDCSRTDLPGREGLRSRQALQRRQQAVGGDELVGGVVADVGVQLSLQLVGRLRDLRRQQ